MSVGAGQHYNVHALDATTGTSLWTFATGGGVLSSPAVANGVFYVGSDDGNLYALDASTGTLLWSDAIGGFGWDSPAVAGGVVYISSGDGNLYALNASTGAKLWSYPIGSTGYSSPAVANGVVYVGSDDGNFYAVDANTGTLLWSHAFGITVTAPAVQMGSYMSVRCITTCTRWTPARGPCCGAPLPDSTSRPRSLWPTGRFTSVRTRVPFMHSRSRGVRSSVM